jgi:8-oxo-dGTP pyrophosphatase MutT (NUDIX family)
MRRDGAFGVGIFDGSALVSMAVAMPARGDDGRSIHNVPGLAHISSVATHPQRWGEGLAGKALNAIMSHARRRGFARVQLFAHATNGPAMRLYAREGFVRSGRTRLDEYGEPHVHFLRELPVAEPVNRVAARLLCRDEEGRVLLMHWRDTTDGHQVWEPPGGGVESDEDPLDAVRREWYEETGLPIPDLRTEPTIVSRDTFWGGGRLVADEYFFLGRITGPSDLAPAALTAGERDALLGWKWFTLAELAQPDDEVVPDLIPILQRLDA